MARPRTETPTPAELEILQAIWDHGPSTVRQVMAVVEGRRARAYTSVMSLMNVMVAKGLLSRRPHGRAFVYHARFNRQRTRSQMLKDVLRRAFDGSAAALVNHLLRHSCPTEKELEEISRTIDELASQKGDRDDGV